MKLVKALFTYDSLLSQISMVSQNVYLFHDTIKNNILFGNPSATDEEIIMAAKKRDAMSLYKGFGKVGYNCRRK